MRHKVRDTLVEDRPEEHVAEDECSHYWIIEAANGPRSSGVCKFCGVKKEFLNSIPQYSNVAKRHTNPLELPEMPDVEFDEEQNSS